MDLSLDFEQGPIRPPSEAGSLLLRVTRNCPWNRCAFCSTYRGRKFSRRSLEEIKSDVDAARNVWDSIIEMSRASGSGGALTRQVLSEILRDPSLPDSFRSVAYWMASGGRTVFLQDANSLMLSTDMLSEILHYVRQRFPQVERITSYARGLTLKGKSVDELIRLKEAGLTRLHVGMESGSDKVLEFIQKGVRSEHLIEGGRRVVAAGISLCLYVIPGIGGVDLSHEHVVETARVVNAINPAHMRFRTLYVRRGTALAEMVQKGQFVPPSEDVMVREIRTIIELLDGVTTTIVSDHILNLLEEIEGTLPQDKPRMLATIDRYLSMSDEDRLLFQLGRRGGALRSLDDFADREVMSSLIEARKQIEREVPGGIPEYMEAVKRRFV
ncbi:radical SAM protein [Desulfomonile tiedjei]|uniref:Fe-S oxidoreductase n=1 Tax=Desulfomonile tiedjei (strain ATCC 49306 / DSM 6799 / DCB-1) TaxID=706587 RepID=I4BZT5_DESTA|nr:radical SAM protein [Desulfomonile tiedjei]AFM22826.1 Fe-S oxidoreductase [Desulfomonile tiedjei DSM 6799]